MNRIIVGLALLVSLAYGSNEQVQKDIADVEAQIRQLNDTLVALKSKLIVKTPKKKEVDKNNEFVTHAALGYIETSGNTKTKTYNVELKLRKNWDNHALNFLYEAQFASDEDNEIKNKAKFELEYDYDSEKKLSLTYLVGYRLDKFSGYESQFYTGPGLKYKAFELEKHKLDLEAHILYSSDEVEDTYTLGGSVVDYPYPAGSVSQNNGYTNSYGAFRLKGIYAWQVLENLKYDQSLSYRTSVSDSQLYFIDAKSTFSSKISKIFSVGLIYDVDYINKAAIGKTTTDKTLTVNLMADY